MMSGVLIKLKDELPQESLLSNPTKFTGNGLGRPTAVTEHDRDSTLEFDWQLDELESITIMSAVSDRVRTAISTRELLSCVRGDL
jgi:hypothetical protein